MTSLGSKLRNQRERLGLTVLEIATQTKIRETYLEAIESDRLETIPGGFFSRSFVRQYARVLGLKHDDIERELEAVTVPPRDAVSVEKVFAEYRPGAGSSGEPLLPGEEEEPEYLHQAEFLKESRTGLLWLTVAVLLIAASGIYIAHQQRPEVFANLLAKQEKIEWPSLPVPAAPKFSVPVVEAAMEVTAFAATPAAPAPAVAAVPPKHSRAVEVAVVAKEKSWVRLIADGTKQFGGTLEAGERRVLNGSINAVVFTGNAGGVELTYNGKSLGAVGPRGLVRTAVFTPRGYEIRANSPVVAGEPPTAAFSQP